ncbi:MAG: hypothetical protein KDC79_12365, partial [Cyclobacteriaceae bacterium]|nr:hypothetical protein [Cyclobacteriaceae bacterium]
MSFFLLASVNAFSQLAATFSNQKDACDGLENGSIEVTVTGITGADADVQFFGPPNFNFTATEGVAHTVTNLKARSYLVVVQDDNDTQFYIVTINDVITALSASVNSTSDNSDCASPNGIIDIDVSGGTGSYSFAWTGPNGFTGTTEDVMGLEGGDYFVDVFDDGTNCSRSLGPITINNPTIAVQNITTSSPLVLCPADDAIIGLDGSELNKTYEIFINGVGSSFSTIGTGSPINVTLPSGNFVDGDVLTVVASQGVCAPVVMNGSVDITLNIESVAPTSALVDNPNYCDDNLPAGGILLSYTGGTLGTGATAEWYDDAAFTNNIGNGNNLNITPAPSVTTTYYVRFEGTCNTTSAQNVTVTVDNASVAPTGALVDNPNYCDDNLPLGGIILSYTGGSLGTGATAEWYDDAAFTSNVGTGNNLNINPAPSVTTTYYVRFEGICGNTTEQNVTVTVDLASVAPTSATVDFPAYCDDAIPVNITLTAVGGSLGTGATVEWYTDAAFTTSAGSGNPLVLAGPGTTTTYYVRYEGTCGNTTGQNVTVTVDNASVGPTSATVDNNNYCSDAAPVNITLTAVGGSLGTGATIEWYTDATFTTSAGSGSPLV